MILKLRKCQSQGYKSTRIVYFNQAKGKYANQKAAAYRTTSTESLSRSRFTNICRNMNKAGQIRLIINSQLTKIIRRQSSPYELQTASDIHHITAHSNVDMGKLTVSCWQRESRNTDQCCYYGDKTGTPKCFPPCLTSSILMFSVNT